MHLSGVKPDATRVVYSPLFRDFRPEKRYSGGQANDLFVFDLKTNSAKRIINHPRADRDPMWIGGLFDGGDTDDVIVVATSSEGATDGAVRPAVNTVLLVAGSVPPAVTISSGISTAPVFQGRAPPVV